MQEPKNSPACDSTTVRHNLFVDKDLPVFKGHFPGAPLVPAALLLEWMLETLPGGNDADASWTILQAKFLKAVEPGMTIVLSATNADDTFSVKVTNNDVTHATAKFKRAR